jgi:hypothetical protein
MIAKNRYRLREYQICEYEDGSLWWNAHHGFAEQQSGRCFTYEDILMFGEFIDKEDGFLKREFLQGLKKLSIWNKTKFYCFLSELLEVSSGRTLDQSWGSQIPTVLSEKKGRAQDTQDEGPGTFRLDKYRITVSGKNQISWQSLEGMDRVIGGQCIIHAGILFIGPKDYEAGTQTNHEFYNGLNEIAPWKRTKFWGSSLASGLASLLHKRVGHITLERKRGGKIPSMLVKKSSQLYGKNAKKHLDPCGHQAASSKGHGVVNHASCQASNFGDYHRIFMGYWEFGYSKSFHYSCGG